MSFCFSHKMSNNYLATYHPDLILKDPAFKVFSEATVPYDKEQNLSIAYNAHKQIQLVQRPRPVPREGEVVVHIRATSVPSFSPCSLPLFLVFESRRWTDFSSIATAESVDPMFSKPIRSCGGTQQPYCRSSFFGPKLNSVFVQLLEAWTYRIDDGGERGVCWARICGRDRRIGPGSRCERMECWRSSSRRSGCAVRRLRAVSSR